jgi:hypothetical protein
MVKDRLENLLKGGALPRRVVESLLRLRISMTFTDV